MTTVQNNLTASLQDQLAQISGSTTKKATDGSDISAVQDRFMTLLVTQMKNQDPLNPMDNAAVTGQMAQLSTVTGINKLNTTLEALKSSYQSSQTMAATGMIGHGVLVPGQTVSLADGKSIFGVELPDPADSLQVTVKNPAGSVVRTLDLGSAEAGVHAIAWDGATDAGTTAANGTYRIEIKALRGGASADATALTFGQVQSVTTGATGVKLNMPGLGALDMSAVRQVM
ncbi:flagellar hook assembly protein FlgD [Noviherbaspirillum galbum]|uniref:Basal-body rod modification protein FlgD n=1 Tax=Noviherbaspirillum galbum TaxID=2709383 RepID=A0A6B3SPL0_9BURK|nr:flagellar hook assembly protein FlgD [Noviherbaspirillum galbum]NEX62677.1 flagellar hook assembly protein FlgD [Noviherbaspirillum galbum]